LNRMGPSVRRAYWNSSVLPRILVVIAMLMTPHLSPALESRTCAKNIHEMNQLWGDPAFPLRWRETSMSDGKPLVLSIEEKKGKLHIQFVKEKEGLWAESTGYICQVGQTLEIEFTGDEIRLGPAANWVLKLAMNNGGKFSLKKMGSAEMSIKTSGWQGLFSSK